MAGFPWSAGQKLKADDLDAEFNNVIALYNNLSGVVGQIQTSSSAAGPVAITLNWAGQSVVTNGTYIIELLTPYQITVSSVNYNVGTAGGSFTANVRNAGVSITGAGAILVNSNTTGTVAATANNVVLVNTQFDVVVTGVTGAPSGATIQINATRASNTLSAIPVATSTVLGGVIIGSGLNITGAGVLSNPQSLYTLPTASPTVLGGVQVDTNSGLQLSGNFLSVPTASATQPGISQTGAGLTVIGNTLSVVYGNTANTAVQGNDQRLAGVVSPTSPAFTGTPTVPTALTFATPTQIANLQYIANQNFLTSVPAATAVLLGLVQPDGTTITNNGGAISVTYGTIIGTAAQGNDSRITGAAPLASPTFIGIPAAPTATAGTNTTQIATTAFVTSAVAAATTGVSSIIGLTGAVTLAALTTAGVAQRSGTNTFTGVQTFSSIPVFPAGIVNYAPIASPTFTGVPISTTAVAGTNTTQIATTAFVTTAVAAATVGVSSIISLTGAVTLAALTTAGVAQRSGTNTFTGVQTFTSIPILPDGVVNYAPIANAIFTGAHDLTGTIPTAPTATLGTNTTQLATTAFVQQALNNDIVGTVISGTGTAGVFHSDAAANMTIDSSYPFPPINIPAPVVGSIWPYNVPTDVVITGVFIGAPQLTGGANNYNFVVVGPSGAIAGLTSITVTGTTGTALYTPTAPISLTANQTIYFQISSITGVIPTNTSVYVQYVGTYN